MRRAVLPWVAATLILVLASVAGISLASGTLFTATAFVRVYLDALARGDGAAAAAMPGVVSSGAGGTLVTAADAMPGLDRIRVVSDAEVAPGRHRISVAWRSGGRIQGESAVTVERAGTTALVFPAWRFATPPTASLAPALRGDDRVAVGARTFEVRPGAALRVLVPGAYAVRMRSPVAQSDARPAVADRPGSVLRVRLTGRATPAFLARIEAQVRSALDACARQQVLYPRGCPFGAAITDRIASTPQWTILARPRIRLSPTDRPDAWRASVSSGTARLRVDVRSLFDGTVAPRNEDAVISGAWAVSVAGDTPRLGALIDAGGQRAS
ncbi:MAG: hypothetical protein HY996_12070 [Micrococcales bacterium]|nr:hypothetical protein [Micrococcales bacterium]